jgi:hypothetical protein
MPFTVLAVVTNKMTHGVVSPPPNAWARGSSGAVRFRWILVGIAILAGLIARFHGLGERPLAVDEYYFLVSVESIIENGVPEPPGGGYYVRGLPLQYLTALSVAASAEPEFGLRLPTVLLGLLVPLVGFFYGRRLQGPELGFSLAVVLLVSSWSVEFSHFGRMYMAFQLLTLLFLLALHGVLDGRAKGANRYLPQLWGVLAFLTHSLGIFLFPLLALPFLLRRGREQLGGRRDVLGYTAATLATGLAVVTYYRTPFRNMGVEERFPDGATGLASGVGVLRLPAFPFWNIGSSDAATLALALGAICAVGLIHQTTRVFGGRPRSGLTFALMSLVAAAGHQLILAVALALIALFRYRIHQEPQRSRAAIATVGAAALISGAWVALTVWLTFGLESRDWLEAASAGTFRSGVYGVLLGWPQIADPIVRPWFREMPVLAVLLGLGVAYQLIRNLRQPIDVIARNPATVVAYIAICFGTFDSLYDRTRYSFFIYPVALAALFLTIQDVAGRLMASSRLSRPGFRSGTWVVAVCIGIFALTEDFSPRHLLNTQHPDVVYRLGSFEHRAATWYSRQDFASPGRFVNERSRPDDAVVVINLPPTSYYVDRPHAVYIRRGDDRFRNVSRAAGTVDYWSGQRLLSLPEELARYLDGRSRSWVIQRSHDPDGSPLEAVISSGPYTATRAFRGADGRIEVVLVETAGGPDAVEGDGL